MVLTFSLISFDFFSPGSVSITYSSKTLNYFWKSFSLIDGSSNNCWTLVRLFFVCHVLNWAATKVLHISHMSTSPRPSTNNIFFCKSFSENEKFSLLIIGWRLFSWKIVVTQLFLLTVSGPLIDTFPLQLLSKYFPKSNSPISLERYIGDKRRGGHQLNGACSNWAAGAAWNTRLLN